MINRSVWIELGFGDVRIGGGVFADNDGYITFTNAEEGHQVGETIPLSEEVEPEDTDVIISFKNKKSVETLIKVLQDLKKEMTPRKKNKEKRDDN